MLLQKAMEAQIFHVPSPETVTREALTRTRGREGPQWIPTGKQVWEVLSNKEGYSGCWIRRCVRTCAHTHTHTHHHHSARCRLRPITAIECYYCRY